MTVDIRNQFQQKDEERKERQRTLKQNAALHLMFTHLADELNQTGWDMRKTLKPSVDIPWTPQTIKEYLFKPIMQAQLQKQSTTELTTVEIDKVVDTLTKHLGQNTGVTVEFPSVESILRKQDLEQMSRGKG